MFTDVLKLSRGTQSSMERFLGMMGMQQANLATLFRDVESKEAGFLIFEMWVFPGTVVFLGTLKIIKKIDFAEGRTR